MTMEAIRRIARQRLGYRSPVYRLAAQTLTDGMTLWREGLATYRQIARLRAAAGDGGKPVAIQFRSLQHPLYLRPGTDDLNAALNNIVRREYGYQPPPHASPEVMVDAGAYIGDTAVFFSTAIPRSRSMPSNQIPKAAPWPNATSPPTAIAST